MQSTHFTVGDMGQRVRGFLDAQAAVIGTAVPAPLRAQLDDAVTKLAAFQAQQGASDSAAKGETAKQQLLRDGIYEDYLHPMEGVATKRLKGETEFPSLVVSAAFRASNKLLAKAGEAADAAAKYEKMFVDNGLPPDFLAQLRAGLAQVTASVTAHGQDLTQRATATAGLIAADKAIRATVDTMNRSLKAVLKSNPALLAGWKATKLVRQPVVTPLTTLGKAIGIPKPASCLDRRASERGLDGRTGAGPHFRRADVREPSTTRHHQHRAQADSHLLHLDNRELCHQTARFPAWDACNASPKLATFIAREPMNMPLTIPACDVLPSRH